VPAAAGPSRYTPVVLLEVANVLSGVGNGVVVIAIPWLVLRETGSATLFGVIAVVAALPTLLALPFVGTAVDRYGPRRISVASDVVSAGSVLGFPVLGATIGLSIPLIVVLAVIGAVIDPAGFTARRAAIAPAARAARVRLDTLNGIHDGLFGIGWAAGPPLGALLIALIGVVSTFLVVAVLFVGAALAMLALRIRWSGVADDGGWHQLIEGFRVLWRDPVLRTITIVNGVLAGLYMPTEVVALPVYFESLGDPAGLGIVLAALAVGYVVGAFSYGALTARVARRNVFRLALLLTFLAAVPFAFLPPLWVLAPIGFVLGLAWGPVSPLVTSLVQTRVPGGVQGRVFAVEMTLITAFPPLFILATGAAVDAWGVRTVYLVLGIAFALTALVSIPLRSVRAMDDPLA